MKTIYLECKKMIFQRGILILILLLGLINVSKTVLYLYQYPSISYVGKNSREKLHQKVLRDYQGKMSEEKAAQLLAAHDAIYAPDASYQPELEAECQILNEYQYQYTYHLEIQNYLDKAEDNIEFYRMKGNTALMRYNRLIQKLYSHRFIDDYYQCSYFSELFEYQFSTLLLLIFSGILSLQFFYREKECGMYQGLIALGRRRKKVFWTKYVSLFLGILGMGLILYLEDFVLYATAFNLHGLGNPIYAVDSYKLSPFNLSILEFYLMICGIRIAVMFLLALFMVVLEQIFGGKFIPVVCAGIVCVTVILSGDAYLDFGNRFQRLSVVWIGSYPCPGLLAGILGYIAVLGVITFWIKRTFHSSIAGIRGKRMGKLC